MILCDVTTPTPSASWGTDEIIVFTPHSNSTLFEVSAAGGIPQALTALDSEKSERGHFAPQVLPGGKTVLFGVGSAAGGHIAVKSLETGERRVVLEGPARARYVPTGHLVFVQAGTLMAVAFDLEQLEVTGEPIPLLQGIMQVGGANSPAHFTFSHTGTLVYLPADTAPQEGRTLVWVDRQGAVQPLATPPRTYLNPRLSPDGQRVTFQLGGGALADIWVYDIRRENLTRLTFEHGGLPIWTPDGERITFQSVRLGPRNLFWKPANGAGDAERLLESELPNTAQSWSPDGKLLAFSEVHPNSNGDIWILPLEGEGKPELFLRTPFSETAPVFSPDGHWLAYRSNESGRYEIYVQPFPGPGGKWQISTEGGGEAAWARGG